MNVDKTRTYIQRSKSSPLELSLKNREGASYLDEATLLVVPHIRRLKSLTVHANVLPSVLRNCCCHAPPLEKLGVCVAGPKNPVLDSAPPNGDLSSLGTLCVRGVITHLPWRNLRNLRVFTLASRPPGRSVTQLLDILESAPLLHTVDLEDSVPDSSDAPPERIVPLCYLKTFTLSADPPHPILLNHLSIPVGASMISWIVFSGEESPLPDYPPEGSPNFRNLSCITSINLSFRVIRKFMRLSGPSGSLHLFAYWEGEGETDLSSYIVDHRVLCSLSPPILSGAQRLSVSKYRHSHPTKSRRLSGFSGPLLCEQSSKAHLDQMPHPPFHSHLEPRRKLVQTHVVSERVLYNESPYHFFNEHLVNMAKNRASRGAKLSSISIVGLGGSVPGREMLKLRGHVVYLECRSDDAPPDWDSVPGESSGEGQ